MPKCSYCGADIFIDSKFCPVCGATVEFDAYKVDNSFEEESKADVSVTSDAAAASLKDSSLEKLSDEQDAAADSMSPKDKAHLLEKAAEDMTEEKGGDDSAPSSVNSDNVTAGELKADISPGHSVHEPEEVVPKKPLKTEEKTVKLDKTEEKPKKSEKTDDIPKKSDNIKDSSGNSTASDSHKTEEKVDVSFSSYGWNETTKTADFTPLPKRKKSKAGCLVALLITLAALAGGGFYVYKYLEDMGLADELNIPFIDKLRGTEEETVTETELPAEETTVTEAGTEAETTIEEAAAVEETTTVTEAETTVTEEETTVTEEETTIEETVVTEETTVEEETSVTEEETTVEEATVTEEETTVTEEETTVHEETTVTEETMIETTVSSHAETYGVKYKKAMGREIFCTVEPNGSLGNFSAINVDYIMIPAADVCPMIMIVSDGTAEYHIEPDSFDGTTAVFNAESIEQQTGLTGDKITKISFAANGRQIQTEDVQIWYND